MGQIKSHQLLSAATATGASAENFSWSPYKTFQAMGTTSAGSGAATIKIQVSNKSVPSGDTDWLDLGTISLTLGTTQTSDGFASAASWRWYRANVTAISGTDASVNVWMGG